MTDSLAAIPRFVRAAARWKLPGAASAALEQLRSQLSVSRVVAEILTSRGYTDVDTAQEFLNPRLDRLHDPFSLRGMHAAVERLRRAIELRELILIYGDYDVDGTTSVIVLKKTIEILGGQADFHIPHRLREGYGMRADVVDQAAATGVRLIVSVDTGIRAAAVVAHANSLGIDVIVTDHHLPEASLPPAVAVVNPNQPECQYPFKDLCGAGVTFKLVQALLSRSDLPVERQQALLDSFLKPVAIATVADVVPLTDENRIIVRRGLTGLRNVRNVGLSALLSVAGFEPGETPSAHQVGFRLAPRMNAAGRMATANDVIDLFLTADATQARTIAERLDTLNRERQQAEREIVDTIVAQCESDAAHLEGAALVFAEAGWHPGVLGIVASRLVERFFRPVFVLSSAATTADGVACYTGSGRSTPAFHLLNALESMSDLFTRFGGHRAAAGLTIPCDSLSNFRQRFSNFAAGSLTEEQRCPEYRVDARIEFSEINDVTVKEILDLGPFGFGNAAPTLLATEAVVTGEAKQLGSVKHLSVPMQQGKSTFYVKAWNFGDRAELFERGNKLDLLLHIDDDPASRKRGYRGWSLSLKDARQSSRQK